jgi:hypothetical protein
MLKTLPWRMMAFGCALGVLAGLLVVAFESDFPDQNFPGQICEYNQETKHEDCTVYSFLPFLLIQVGKTLNNYGIAITAIAAILLTFVTGGLVWVGYVQLRTTRAQLRAYVFVESAHIEGVAIGHTPLANVTIKNFGQTPAFRLRQWARMGFQSFPLVGPIPKTAEDTITAERPLAPGGVFHVRLGRREIDSETITALQNGTHAIFIAGEIFYRDTFNRRHQTNYCLFAGGPIGISGEVADYELYNDAK